MPRGTPPPAEDPGPRPQFLERSGEASLSWHCHWPRDRRRSAPIPRHAVASDLCCPSISPVRAGFGRRMLLGEGDRPLDRRSALGPNECFVAVALVHAGSGRQTNAIRTAQAEPRLSPDAGLVPLPASRTRTYAKRAHHRRRVHAPARSNSGVSDRRPRINGPDPGEPDVAEAITRAEGPVPEKQSPEPADQQSGLT